MNVDKQNQIIDRFLARPPDLKGGVNLDVAPLDGQRALLELRHDGHHFSGRAAALALPYPSALSRMMSANPDVEIVLVERASQNLVRSAEELGVSCLDLSGMGRVVGPGFVYFASGPMHIARPPGGDIASGESESSKGRPRISPFAPKASRVVRAVLDRPHEPWRVSAIADRAAMNPGNAHRILGALVELGFMERDADRYVVIEPGSLLEAWCEQARISRDDLWLPVLGAVIQDVDRLISDLGRPAAVSGELAAELYEPHLAAEGAIVHVLDPDPLDNELIRSRWGMPSGPRAGRIAVRLSDPGVGSFGRERAGLPLVAAPQLYCDLYRNRGRGREAAERVREVVLGY